MPASDQLVQSWLIAEIVDEWLRDNESTHQDLAAKAFVAPDDLWRLRDGQLNRISRDLAGRLLAAMDQPMRPEIAAAYRKWMREKKLKPRTIQVVR